ncbi:MAG: VOC family protein [Amaricoccus sp.]|uniref:VOC family protein n=1 Tax=Amaricoccus sp. TaxID=1872485 RepID=UPI0039E714E5
MDLELTGLHHVTAITADAPGNRRFYTDTLGLRLVKKTVNQDDTSAYHLFYADGLASPGTDLTFFDWPVARERRGTHSISRTGLRVAGEASLGWWRERLAAQGLSVGEIATVDGRATLDFEDPEGQRLRLTDDGGLGAAHAWGRSPVPAAHQNPRARAGDDFRAEAGADGGAAHPGARDGRAAGLCLAGRRGRGAGLRHGRGRAG